MTATLLLASANPGKIREFADLLAGVTVVGLADVGITDLDEPYDDFAKNAAAKAVEASRRTKLPALADDSGLCVDALGGAPGVFSARYAGGHGDDRANRALLLERLRDVADPLRTARFRCVLCLADVHGALAERQVWTLGECEGLIAREARGTHGFGYDPLFVLAGTDTTLAELTPAQKHRHSHRARATEIMLPIVRNYLAAP
jgi:XTP/dITP diphosphohydrolase